MNRNSTSILPAMLLTVTTTMSASVADDALHFDTDPGWESYHSRLVPDRPPVVRQDFGYRTSQFARGMKAGEIGGWVQRSITPAYYGMVIPPKSLEDKLTASGKFAVTKSGGGSGALFG